MGYSVLAVHNYDGSKFDLVKVSGNAQYLDYMQRVSASPKPLPLSRLEKLRRWWNKRNNRPATADIGILSNIISDIAKETRLALPDGTGVEHIVVSTPLFLGLVVDDLNEAIDYAGFKSWQNYDNHAYPGIFPESNAVFAGLGEGLCDHYRDLYDCWDEEEERFKYQPVYLIR
jgi:hypothetical protein